jgi:hypothetical protein
MIPEFPENRKNNREFFKIFGSVLIYLSLRIKTTLP